MTNDKSFSEALNAKIDGKTLPEALDDTSRAEIDYLASLADRIKSTPTPTLSADAKDKMLNVMLSRTDLESRALTRQKNNQIWPLLVAAASILIIIGVGLFLLLNNNPDASGTDVASQNTEVNIDACPQGLGFWKTNQQAWTITELNIGNQSYTQDELFNLLNTPPRGGDQSIVLIQEVILVYLNNNADSASDLISQADELFAQFDAKPPLSLRPNTDDGRDMQRLAQDLKRLNGTDDECED